MLKMSLHLTGLSLFGLFIRRLKWDLSKDQRCCYVVKSGVSAAAMPQLDGSTRSVWVTAGMDYS